MASEADPCPAWLRAALAEVRCLEEMKPNLDSLANYIALGLGYLERADLDDVLRDRMLDVHEEVRLRRRPPQAVRNDPEPRRRHLRLQVQVGRARARRRRASNRGHGKKPERLSIWKVGLDVQKMMNDVDLSDMQSYPLPVFVLKFAAEGNDLLEERRVKQVVNAVAPYFAAIVGPNPSPHQRRASRGG